MVTALALLVLGAALALLLGSAALTLLAPRPAGTTGPSAPFAVIVPLGADRPGLAEATRSLARLAGVRPPVLLGAADPAARAVATARAAIGDRLDVTIVRGLPDSGPNPKIANLAPAIAAAPHDLVLVKDQQTILAPDAAARMAAALDAPGVGLVSAVPLAAPGDSLASAVDWAFVTLYGARLVTAGAALGLPIGLGAAMLMRRNDLSRVDGLAAMAASVADDQALAKAMRRHGLGTRLVEGVALQAGGPRSLGEVWRRHLRWALCRRIEAPLAFAVEPALGLAAAVVAAALVAPTLGLPAPLAMAALACLWSAVETALAAAKGWPTSRWAPLVILIREIMLPALWGAALATRRIRWGGREVAVRRGAGARPA